jgi:predicted KAP-like P-loop ATPase
MALCYERALPKVEELASQNKYLLNADIAYQRTTLRNILISDEKTEGALYYWHLKTKVAESPNVIVVKFSPWLIAGRAELASALLSELARALNEYLGPEVRKAFKEILQRLSEFAPLAGTGLDMMGHGLGAIPRATGTLSKAIADRMTTGPTLEELRSKLKEILFRISDRRILVILDDVDRLTPTEATETISLVKSLGDLPNVIYLFSYHRETVCKLKRVGMLRCELL